ncbi:MAG: hypothetical protein IT406_03605 [Candidatus Yanofskybacteria bacterium]|nr:hypothetical protein [Candidatus Yanofskybacteria bacterium]
MKPWHRVGIGVLVLVLIGAAALVWRSYRGSGFPRYTIEADGSISKDLPKLSTESLARISSPRMKGFIFGVHPIVLETAAPHAPNVERVVFTVENSPSDIQREYGEYFDVIGWEYTVTKNPLRLTVQKDTFRMTVDIAPRSNGESILAITRSSKE